VLYTRQRLEELGLDLPAPPGTLGRPGATS
jgi:hypothetical protein